ncbi:serine/threonine protein kinase [Metallosphaera tengchongensis]|uniref:Serine/threonine protein kinase n=1 Tax=Metallosphaera tengchongensis TaxID=1532350 RepID=A0A6N0NVN0_9CREN|nr:serine/threonine protein kinase [Metallosphaera tengchongensis]QKR00954.1 serine/threonine protein kinase [Metallosphaera tengchongensis]
MVEIRNFIFPRYSEEIEEELLSLGINAAYSFGGTILGKLKVLGKGKTGVVVLTQEGLALKIRRTDSPKESLEMEAKMQVRAGEVAPKVMKYGKNFILMEYVEGRHLEYRESPGVIIDLLTKARRLEEVNLEHKEIVHPWKNVLVRGEETYILDYDSVSMKERAFNVNRVLNAFGFHELAKEYKRGGLSIQEVVSRIRSLF